MYLFNSLIHVHASLYCFSVFFYQQSLHFYVTVTNFEVLFPFKYVQGLKFDHKQRISPTSGSDFGACDQI